MDSYVINQAYLFLVFLLNGFLIGILFDIFRILRKTFKTSDFITYLEDIIFWIISGIITLYTIFKFNNGQIRLYIFVGIIFGSILYMLLFSKIFIKINVLVINCIKKVILKIINIILYPLKYIFKLIIKPINFVVIKIKMSNIKSIFRNLFKKSKKEELKKDFT